MPSAALRGGGGGYLDEAAKEGEYMYWAAYLVGSKASSALTCLLQRAWSLKKSSGLAFAISQAISYHVISVTSAHSSFFARSMGKRPMAGMGKPGMMWVLGYMMGMLL